MALATRHSVALLAALVAFAPGCETRTEKGCLALSHLEDKLVPDLEAAGYLPTPGPIAEGQVFMDRLKYLVTSDTEEARRWRDWQNTLDDLKRLCH